MQFEWEEHLNGAVLLVFFNFKSRNLMVYKSVFSTNFNGSLRIISDLLAFTRKLDNKP